MEKRQRSQQQSSPRRGEPPVDARSADDRDGNYGAATRRAVPERPTPRQGTREADDRARHWQADSGYEPDHDGSYQYEERGFGELSHPYDLDRVPQQRPHHRFVSDPGYGARGWIAPPSNGPHGGEPWAGYRSHTSASASPYGRSTAPKVGKGPKGYSRSDDRIREEISEHLSETGHDWSEVEVRVQGGEVTLTGTIAERPMKHEAERIAESVRGVVEVTNQLRTTRAAAPSVEASSSSRGAANGVTENGRTRD